MTQIYVVELGVRPAARERRGLVRAHRTYWQRMLEAGVLVSGGEFADRPGELLLCVARDRAHLSSLLEPDPYFEAKVVDWTAIRELRAVPGLSRTEGPGKKQADVLTPHEERIAGMMLDGSTNWQIAERLKVSTRAVELHITRMYRKLGISRRAQLAAVFSGVRSADPGFAR